MICPHCGNEYSQQDIDLTSVHYYEIVSINYKKILSDVLGCINITGCTTEGLCERPGNYLLTITDRQYLLIFDADTTDFTTVIRAIDEKEGIVFIQITDNPLPTLPDTTVIVAAIDILKGSLDDIKFRLRDLPSSQKVISNIKQVALVEQEILNKSSLVTWQAVENELTNFFLDKLRTQQVELYKYRLMLESFPRFRRIPVNAAGAGNADKLTIDLLEYLNEVIKGDFTADAKCYTSTAVDHHTIEKVQHHLSKDKFDSRRILILATTNKVTCWEDVHNFRVVAGQYHLLIFSARIIAEVTVQLDFDKEFLRVLGECVK